MGSEKDEKGKSWECVKSANGILIPGGFGDRGIEGKIAAAKYARTNKIPFLGICLGMQIAVIEFARNVLEWEGANSAEFDKTTKYPVVVFMPEIDPKKMGGTLRLGKKKTVFCLDKPETSIAFKLYGSVMEIEERHRHRYEVNINFVPHLEKRGMRFVGQDVTKTRMEIIELSTELHPFYVACQFHPEFLSLMGKPSPLYLGFIQQASITLKQAI